MSYFEGGRLLFASGVGVRIHGGGSRITAPRPGFRLYFRRKYGPREVPPGILFSPDAQPIRRLIVHDDVRRDSDRTDWYFANPLAYDIARAVGAIAPETKPVRFFLNGEYYGPFVLTERFDERYFAAHWGYDDILLSQEEMDKLWEWVLNTRPLTMSDRLAACQRRQPDPLVPRRRILRHARHLSGPRPVSRPDQGDRRMVLGELGHGPELSRLESRQLPVPAGTHRRGARGPQSRRAARADSDHS